MAIKHDHYKKLSGHKKINIIPITDRLKTEQKKTQYIQKLLSFSWENRWNTTRPCWENEIWLNTS